MLTLSNGWSVLKLLYAGRQTETAQHPEAEANVPHRTTPMASVQQDHSRCSDVTRPLADPARVRLYRRVVLVLGSLALLSALAFPFAPVRQPMVDYTWSGGSGAAATAIPLMPYQPISLSAAIPCNAISA